MPAPKQFVGQNLSARSYSFFPVTCNFFTASKLFTSQCWRSFRILLNANFHSLNVLFSQWRSRSSWPFKVKKRSSASIRRKRLEVLTCKRRFCWMHGYRRLFAVDAIFVVEIQILKKMHHVTILSYNNQQSRVCPLSQSRDYAPQFEWIEISQMLYLRVLFAYSSGNWPRDHNSLFVFFNFTGNVKLFKNFEMRGRG